MPEELRSRWAALTVRLGGRTNGDQDPSAAYTSENLFLPFEATLQTAERAALQAHIVACPRCIQLPQAFGPAHPPAPDVFDQELVGLAPPELVTPSSDIYALGVLLYELCAGGPPGEEVNLARPFSAVQNRDAPPVSPLGGLKVLPAKGKPVITLSNEDEALLDVVQGLRHVWAAARAEGAGTTRPVDNPYRGLAAFDEEHAHLFFGRERLTRQLWQAFFQLHQEAGALRILSILGPSGSGKSSVALAGLVPLLRREPMPGWSSPRVVVFTPGEWPLTRLARELMKLLPSETFGTVQDLEEGVLRRRSATGGYEGLWRFAGEILKDSAQHPLVVVVDQFEEVYTQCKDEAERDLFVSLLLHAAAHQERLFSVVLTLRSDFFNDTRRHPELNRAIARNEAVALVPVMTREELRRAIAAPAEQQGRPLIAGTVELLLTEVAGRQGALPLLEFTLSRIWQGLEEGLEPTQTLATMGGVGGALAGEAERIYLDVGEEGQRIARRAFLGMVQLGEGVKDTRRRVAVAGLVAQGEIQAQVLVVLRRFAQSGMPLVTLTSAAEEILVEVAHDALFEHWQRLRVWLDEGRANLRFHRRLSEAVKHWEKNGWLAVHLWQPPDLDLLRKFRDQAERDMTQGEVAFLDASVRAKERRRVGEQQARETAAQSLRVLVAVMTIVAMVIGGLGIVAWWKGHAANRAKREAQLGRFLAEQGRQETQRGAWQRALVYVSEADQRPALSSGALRAAGALADSGPARFPLPVSSQVWGPVGALAPQGVRPDGVAAARASRRGAVTLAARLRRAQAHAVLRRRV